MNQNNNNQTGAPGAKKKSGLGTVLLLLACTVLLLSRCGKGGEKKAAPSPTATPKATLSLSTPAPSPVAALPVYSDLNALNDLFCDECQAGHSSFSFVLQPNAWAGMDVPGMLTAVRWIGYRWCAEGFGCAMSPADNGAMRIDVTNARFRDGIRMARSYELGLYISEDELNCLWDIMFVVDELQRSHPNDPLGLEIAIYDYIHDHVEYHTFEEFPVGDARRISCTSAITAFREGWGNCQAYSDLFYLMSRRAGLDVDYLCGDAGGGHMWNTICYQNKYYMVDVTFGDSSNTHYFLNFGLDRCGDRVWPQQQVSHSFQSSTSDWDTYYSLDSYDFGLSVKTYGEAGDFCLWKFNQGFREAEILLLGIPMDVDAFNNCVYRAFSKANVAANWSFNLFETMDGNTVATITFT